MGRLWEEAIILLVRSSIILKQNDLGYTLVWATAALDGLRLQFLNLA